LKYKQVLYEPDVPIGYVYFPIDGVASLVVTMMNGAAAEVGTIDSEGVVGMPILLDDRCAPTSAYIQVPGQGLRIEAGVFRQELESNSKLRTIMHRYIHAFFNQVALSAACPHFHSLEERCCRWVLMTADRMPSDEFTLTQEFLAMMLGVRRTSVTFAMASLKNAGLLRYSRGHVKILDRDGLAKRACECYAVSKAEFDRLLGDTVAMPRTDRAHRLTSQVG
jgi:CRP-like cAMP-binding protein